MKVNDPLPEWKEVNTLNFWGISLLIPISILVFDVVLGYIFRGFLQENSETIYMVLINILHLCLGACLAAYVYRFRKSYLIILCSAVVLIVMQVLIQSSYLPNSIESIIGNILAERIWIYIPLLIFIYLFRYSEARLDFAEAINVSEQTDKTTNLKYNSGTCSKCGGITVVAREKIAGKNKKIEFFCDHCGRLIRGNPLTSAVFGLALVILAIAFLYAMNAGSQRSAVDAFNLIFCIVLFVGAKSLYNGIRWTHRSLTWKNTDRV